MVASSFRFLVRVPEEHVLPSSMRVTVSFFLEITSNFEGLSFWAFLKIFCRRKGKDGWVCFCMKPEQKLYFSVAHYPVWQWHLTFSEAEPWSGLCCVNNESWKWVLLTSMAAKAAGCVQTAPWDCVAGVVSTLLNSCYFQNLLTAAFIVIAVMRYVSWYR